MKTLWFCGVLSLCSTCAQAGPNINIGTVYDYLDGDKSTYLKRVFNGGSSTAFVRVNIFEMTFDAAGQATEHPLDNHGEYAARRSGLVASPARLIVPASGMQALRLLYVGERDHERYYRVRYVPVVPEREDQFAVSEVEREQYKASLTAGVNIMAGYGAVFFVRPKHTRFDTKVQDSASQYRVQNAGNSTIELGDFRDCSQHDPRECLATRSHHVLPGKAFELAKVAGRVYAYELIEGDKKTKVKLQP